MQNLSSIREHHFKENCLAWVALYHFLPSDLVYELSSVLVDVISSGQLDIGQLFDQDAIENDRGLGSWSLKPLDVNTPLSQYLQRRIRSFSWASDWNVGHDTSATEATEISPEDIEHAARFGQADFGFPVSTLDKMKFTQSSIRSIVTAFKTLQSSHSLPGTESIESAAVGPCAEISMPLSAVAMKHLGDLCADADEWEKAHLLYERAISAFSNFNEPAWDEFATSLKGILLQSCATALRTTKGAGVSSAFLSNHLDRTPIAGHPLFQLNASHDAFVVASLSSEQFFSSPDLRASISLAPLLLKTHNLASALESSAEENFAEAHRYFWQILRRQIALGSASDSRITKAFYARSLFNDLEKSIDHDNKIQSFTIAVRLLLESGQTALARKLIWTEKFAQTYIHDKAISDVIAHASKNEGSRDERRNVVIELFGGWTTVLASNQGDLATFMQTYLIRTAKDHTQTRLNQANTGQRSLELLNKIADERPEFRSSIADAVADTIIAIINKQVYWTVFAEVLETANYYLDVFSPTDLTNVVTAVLAFLETLDPEKGLWTIVRPSLDILTSTEAKQLSDKNPVLGHRIFSTVLQFGLKQETEHARLLFYLRDFDVVTTGNESMLTELNEIVGDVRRKALAINSSNAVENIRALLIASNITRKEGVKDALNALAQIAELASSKRPSISFPLAYEALLLLADQQTNIARNISLEIEEFRSWLVPILDCLPAIWLKAKENPLIFTTFSLPAATKSNPVIIHNWAFASINFALSLGKLPFMLSTLESAAEAPALCDSIRMARTTRLAAEDLENVDPAAIGSESRKAFYSALGQRLTRLRKMAEDARSGIINSLLNQCFRQGPHGLDLAVFLTAMELGISNFEVSPDYQNYKKRLDSDRELRLAIAPILFDAEKK